MHNISSEYYHQGKTDGRLSKPINIPPGKYQDQVDYLVGYEEGEAEHTAVLDLLSEEERRQMYGEEHDQA